MCCSGRVYQPHSVLSLSSQSGEELWKAVNTLAPCLSLSELLIKKGESKISAEMQSLLCYSGFKRTGEKKRLLVTPVIYTE